MNKKIISKVGKRHRPEIDMMEYIQIEETREFDLDKHVSDGAKLPTINKKDSDILFSDFSDDNDVPLKLNHDTTQTRKVSC